MLFKLKLLLLGKDIILISNASNGGENMKKNDIEKVTKDIVSEILVETDYILVDVEFVKEGASMFLRIYLDKPEGITIDDCQEISQKLSKKLDEVDPIDENYFLEVSSPGLDRPLKTDKDLKLNIKKDVEVSLYKSYKGYKKHMGRLIGFNDKSLDIENEDGEVINIDRDIIAKINLAVKF